MRILIVEDDHFQAEWVAQAILEHWKDAEVERISTESDFRAALPDLARRPPAVIVLDVMLRWADPAPEIPPRPDDVKNDGVYNAGFRCQKLLAENEQTRTIPIVFYTVLEASDLKGKITKLPSTIKYVHKDANSRSLLTEIAAHLERG